MNLGLCLADLIDCSHIDTSISDLSSVSQHSSSYGQYLPAYQVQKTFSLQREPSWPAFDSYFIKISVSVIPVPTTFIFATMQLEST